MPQTTKSPMKLGTIHTAPQMAWLKNKMNPSSDHLQMTLYKCERLSEKFGKLCTCSFSATACQYRLFIGKIQILRPKWKKMKFCFSSFSYYFLLKWTNRCGNLLKIDQKRRYKPKNIHYHTHWVLTLNGKTSKFSIIRILYCLFSFLRLGM